MVPPYAAVASLSALITGTLLSTLFLDRYSRASRQKALKQSWQGASTVQTSIEQGFAQLILTGLTHADAGKQTSRQTARIVAEDKVGKSGLQRRLVLAGLEDVNPETAAAFRMRLAVMAGVAGLVGGVILTPLAALIFGVVFALVGWASVSWALDEAAKLRTRAVEQRISEAVEVMCLGLRAGLSFDRSLELYWESFPGGLGGEFFLAQQTWQTGLMSREDALRSLARRYDSPIFQRVIDSIVRSLHFGSPLAGSLEELAQEARRVHRSKVEEAVMKAPVKMMLPIGVLILPSMLLLVMGPIMLELFTGF